MKYETVTVRVCIFLQTYGWHWSKEMKEQGWKSPFARTMAWLVLQWRRSQWFICRSTSWYSCKSPSWCSPDHTCKSLHKQGAQIKNDRIQNSLCIPFLEITPYIKTFFFKVHKVINHSRYSVCIISSTTLWLYNSTERKQLVSETTFSFSFQMPLWH